jgi:hypothetical protein
MFNQMTTIKNHRNIFSVEKIHKKLKKVENNCTNNKLCENIEAKLF